MSKYEKQRKIENEEWEAMLVDAQVEQLLAPYAEYEVVESDIVSDLPVAA